MDQHFDVVTIGDATLDTFLDIQEASVHCDLNKKNYQLCFNYAEKIPINDARQSVGGDAANVAVGVKKLGHATAIVTELGDDINGSAIEDQLEQAGVNVEHVKIVRGATSRYSVVLTFKGERTILSYHPKHHYAKPTLPKTTHWIYFTSLGRGSEKIQDIVSMYLKKYPDTKLATNPGSYQLREGLKYYKKIIPRAEIIFLNREEAQMVVEKNSPASGNSGAGIKKLMEAIHALGPKIVVITDGENGSYASDGGQIYQHKNYPVRVLSKTGAGDAYASGFLGARLAKKDVPAAMQWGTANAAGVIGKFGAQEGLLNEGKIKKMIQTFSSVQPELL